MVSLSPPPTQAELSAVLDRGEDGPEVDIVAAPASPERFAKLLQHALDSGTRLKEVIANQATFLSRQALDRVFRDDAPDIRHRNVVDTITFQVGANDNADMKGFTEDLQERRACIEWLQATHNITFQATISLRSVSSPQLERLTQEMIHAGFSAITFELALEETAPEELVEIGKVLAEFGARPIARDASIRSRNIPFCTLPPQHFRWAYRETLDAIPGHAHIFRQQALIQRVRSAEHDFHPGCRTCRRRAACYAFTDIGPNPHLRTSLVASHEKTVVFAGASLQPEDIRAHDATDIFFASPARQYDGVITALEGFESMLLLDGYFFQSYALTTFETLLVLLEDIHVFGSSSLGAVRALELANYGMRGQGHVYDFLRGHNVVPYHAVAQTYDQNDQAASEPLVGVHRFLEAASSQGLISSDVRETCYEIAGSLHFSELTYRRLFWAWRQSDQLTEDTVARLQAFHDAQDRGALDVKRQDALDLLNSFRRVIADDGPGYSRLRAETARDMYLERLRSKYEDSPSRTLRNDWRGPEADRRATKRARSLESTLRDLRRFFEDLDVTVAETSFLDAADYRMINVVFVPFFFLDYGNSSGTGFGRTLKEALVSAYAEVFERIPCGTLRTQFAARAAPTGRTVPRRSLPFFASMHPKHLNALEARRRALPSRAFVHCTDLLCGEVFSLPADAARLPSSCGMAAGSTLLEALVYGLYEVLEHDVSSLYETEGVMAQMGHLVINAAEVVGPQLNALIEELRHRGHRVHFFQLINRYGLPLVLCAFYDADRRLVFSGQCCRHDLRSAMTHAFQEALNGHFISYFGSRDDRRGFEQRALDPETVLDQLVADAPRMRLAPTPVLNLEQQLDHLLAKLREHDVEHVFALDLGPTAEHGLAAAKVIVPGLHLRTAEHRDPSFFLRCEETRRDILRLVEKPSLEDPATLSVLKARYRRAKHRFFKA